VHSADGWRALLEPMVARYRGIVKRLYFRGDAAFANPETYEFLGAEGAGYTIRLAANSVLQSGIGYLLKVPVGRPPHEVRRHFASFRYQGAELEQAAPRGGQGQMAPWRALPTRRLHRDPPGAACRARRRLLQPARHLRAVYQPAGTAPEDRNAQCCQCVALYGGDGCQWRQLAREFPPDTTAQDYFYAWHDGGVLQRINFELLLQVHEAEGREPSPSVGGYR
jgi:transposase